MKLLKKKEDSYLFKDNNGVSNILNISIDKKCIIMTITDELKPELPIYNGSFTIGNLIDIDQRFRAFFDVQSFKDEINLAFNDIEMSKEDDKMILTFTVIGSKIHLPLSNEPLSDKEKIKQLSAELKEMKSKNENLEKNLETLKKELSGFYSSGKKTNFTKEVVEPTRDFANASSLNSPVEETPELENQEVKEVNKIVIDNFDISKDLRKIVNNIFKDKEDLDISRFKSQVPFTKQSKLSLRRAIINFKFGFSSLSLLNDGRLASGSCDTKIRIYNLDNYQCELIIKEHSQAINSLCTLENGCLVSSSDDGTIMMFEINKKEYKLLTTLAKHSNSVTKVIKLSNNRLGSCSLDRTIKIWNTEKPYFCIKSIEVPSVKSFIELKNQKYIVSTGIYDETLSFWNNTSYICEKKIEGIECLGVDGLIEIKNNRIVVGGTCGVCVVNATTFTIDIQFNREFDCVTSLVLMDDNTVFCGCKYKGEEGCFINMQIDSWQYTVLDKKINAHDGYILSMIKFDEGLISCSEDKTIKVWK